MGIIFVEIIITDILAQIAVFKLGHPKKNTFVVWTTNYPAPKILHLSHQKKSCYLEVLN